MESIAQVLQSSASPLTCSPSQRRLNDEDGAKLFLLLSQMAQRYPAQDMTDSLEGYLQDCETLALRYSLPKVYEALAALRTKPDQTYFPRPDEVASEIERQAEMKSAMLRAQDWPTQCAREEEHFWHWIDEQLESHPEMAEQQLLDSIKAIGFTGRKARAQRLNRST